MRRLGVLAVLVVRRALSTPGLLVIRFIGVLVAVVLVAGVSLYSTGMGDAMLQARLATDPSNENLAVSLMNTPLMGARYAALDRYTRHAESVDLGLPLRLLYVHHTTSTVPVYRLDAHGKPAGKALAPLALDYFEGLRPQIKMVAGSFDAPARRPNGDVTVLISRHTAETLGLRLGDRIQYVFGDFHPKPIAPDLVVAGIFAPRNINSDYWGSNAGDSSYRSLVTPHLSTFQAFAVHGQIFGPEYFWLQETNVSDVHLASANTTLDNLDRVRSKIAELATGASLLSSLSLNIDGFLYQYGLLPYILLILVAPIVALVLYAVAVTTTLALERQAGEIVWMRSRGATRVQVFATYTCEAVVLGAIAVLIGPLLGLPLAHLIGRTSGFLSFRGGLPIVLSISGQTYLYAALTALLCLLVGLLPAIHAARRSMTAFKGEQARPRGRPLWQRLFLDVVVLALALYGLSVLVRQGPVASGDATAVIGQDPFVAVAPLLFAVAITLIISRILPWLATLGLYVLGRLSSPAAHVALQSVARAPRQPMRLVQLCTLTLTFGIFAATVAGVEGRNLADQQMYQAGSTVRLQEFLDRKILPPSMRNEPDAMPLSAHLKLPGVHAATPALRYESFGNIVNTTDDGTTVNVLGIDPATAGRVMWFRPDFADQSFGQLLKTVAAPGPSAIVSDGFLSATGLHRGDTFNVTLSNNKSVHLRIAAVAHYFPTLDTHDAPFVVTNLSYLNRESKSYGANEVWLSTDRSQSTIDRLLQQALTWPRHVISYEGIAPATTAQDNPLSVGIYGVVSVGFLLAVGLTLLGFGVYAYLVLQQRLSEVAIIRALGFSQGQVRSLLLCEQGFLLGAAILGGIVAGVLTTKLFLPYLPIAVNMMPPFLVVMPWGAVGEFVLVMFIVFLLILTAHVSVLLRLQLGRVLRLGDA